MEKKRAKILAEKIVGYEKKIKEGDKSAEVKIEELISSLVFEDMMQIDDYIQRKRLLE